MLRSSCFRQCRHVGPHLVMPPGKRRRISVSDCESLQRILHSGGISQSGLASLLKTLRQNPVECDTVHAIRRANMADFIAISRATRLPLTSGREWAWEYLDPNKLLSLALDRSVELNRLFASAMESKPPTMGSPWKLVIGFDAFIPGFRMCRLASVWLSNKSPSVRQQCASGSCRSRNSDLQAALPLMMHTPNRCTSFPQVVSRILTNRRVRWCYRLHSSSWVKPQWPRELLG
jgi:hypothetical protein